jgi:hypothetical protein
MLNVIMLSVVAPYQTNLKLKLKILTIHKKILVLTLQKEIENFVPNGTHFR